MLVSAEYGTRSLEQSEASGCVHIALLKQPCSAGPPSELPLQAVRPTARPDSAFECFPGSVISEWALHVTDSFELPMQLLKCILLLKNKRNNLYSLTKVLKKMNFLVSQQIFPN